MTLLNHTITIISGINDIPSTPGDPNHPNGSLVCAKYNSLIQELDLVIPKTSDDLVQGATNKYFSNTLARNAISVTGNGSYDNSSGVITINNTAQGIDHVELTNTNGLVKTYTIWGDSNETVNLGTFSVNDGVQGVQGPPGTNGPSVIVLTQSAYDALGTYDSNTFYVIS
jgi:hypothetical protein